LDVVESGTDHFRLELGKAAGKEVIGEQKLARKPKQYKTISILKAEISIVR
jgi:hypothetical protein